MSIPVGHVVTQAPQSIQSPSAKYRFVAAALHNASLPGTQLACEAGCLDDTPNDPVDECGQVGLAPHKQLKNLSPAVHTACRALIVPYCTP